MNKFIIDKSLQTNGNLTVQGDLEVKGTTQTVNQETLTVKDNFIAINGNGTTLNTQEHIGLIAINGEEHYILNGAYLMRISDIINVLGVQVILDESAPWVDYFGSYQISATNIENVDRFNNLALSPTVYRDLEWTFEIEGTGPLSIWNRKNNPDFAIAMNDGKFTIYAELSQENKGTFEIKQENAVFYFQGQIIQKRDLEFVKSILKNLDGSEISNSVFEIKREAYAAPIYDSFEDSLKIGMGSYEKDENGNITSFTFGAGQGQSIATRADLYNNEIPCWSESQNSLVNSGISIHSDTLLFNKKQLATIEDVENAAEEIVSVTFDDEGHPVNSILSGAYAQSPKGFRRVLGWTDTSNDEPGHLSIFTFAAEGAAASPNRVPWFKAPGSTANSNPTATLQVCNPVGEWDIVNKRYGDDTYLKYSDPTSSIYKLAAKTCTASGSRSIALGNGSSAIGTDSIAIGHGAKAGTDQTMLGIFNNIVSQRTGKALVFGVGTGGSDATRKNALEIYYDGSVAVYKQATEPTDIVNKEYVDNVIANVGGAGGGTTVTVGGVAQETWNADTKVDEWNGISGGYYTIRCRAQNGQGISNTYTIAAYTQPKEYAVSIYNTGGILRTNEPQADLDCVNKEYADTNFAPKVSNTAGVLRAWVSNGVAGYWADLQSNAASATPNRYAMYLPETDGDKAVAGYMLTNIPTRDYHAANKKYVDEQIAKVSGGSGRYLHIINCMSTYWEGGTTLYIKNDSSTPYTQGTEILTLPMQDIPASGTIKKGDDTYVVCVLSVTGEFTGAQLRVIDDTTGSITTVSAPDPDAIYQIVDMVIPL